MAIPSTFDADARAKFLARVSAAVKQQVGLAEQSPHVLRVTGELIDAGACLLIPHESAAPLDPVLVEGADDKPDIDTLYWLSWALSGALRAAAAARIPHGGIQLGSVFRDESGAIKLGDFGLATAFEAVAGVDVRRQVHCEHSAGEQGGRATSGVWSMLDEDAPRDFGWILPYFGHELLDGKMRLNPKSDQFALGVVLFLLATGTHPYGAALSDPSLMFYFHLESYHPRDERRDWKDVFERADKGVSGPRDRPILSWSEFVLKLLASDPGGRYENAAEAEKVLVEFVPADLGQAAEALQAANAALNNGDAQGCLEKAGPWKTNAALPELWRTQLAAWLDTVEAQKEVLGRVRRLRQQLKDAHKALDILDLGKARELATGVRAAPEADDELRRGADELIAACDEQARVIESGADSVAEAYLDSALTYVEQGELAAAREILDGMLADPATPAARGAQARELITQIELLEQQTERQLSSLNEATEDIRAGRYEAGRQALEALLQQADLPEALAEQGRLLLGDIDRRQAERAAHVDALNAARDAWERADADGLRKKLATVPPTFGDEEIESVRGDLAERLTQLDAALQAESRAATAVKRGDAAEAVKLARAARAAPGAPQVLQDRLDALVRDCEQVLEEGRRAALGKAREALAEAQREYDGGKLDRCRNLIQTRVLTEIALPGEEREQAELLLKACQRVEAAAKVIEHVRGHLKDQAFDDATRLLDSLDAADLPARQAEQIELLHAEIERQQAEYVAAKTAELQKQIATTGGLLEHGRLADVTRLIEEAGKSKYLTAELRAECDRVRQRLDLERPVLAKIEKIEAALRDPAVDPAKVLKALEPLSAGAPGWAGKRIEQARKRCAELADEHRRARVAAASAAFDEAASALAALQPAAARQALEANKDARGLDPALATRFDQLVAELKVLERWLPKVEQLEAAGSQGDPRTAVRDAQALRDDSELPKPLRPRVEQVATVAAAAVQKRREAVGQELSALAAELQKRGKRARDFPARVQAAAANDFADANHKQQGEKLVAAYTALPEPTSQMPLLIGGVIGVLVLAAAGLYLSGALGGGGSNGGGGNGGGGNGGQDGPPIVRTEPPVTPEPPVTGDADLIAATLARVQGEFATARQAAVNEGRQGGTWTLAFEPSDGFPSTLIATGGDGRRVTLATIQPDQAARLEIGALVRTTFLEDLFPKPPPAGPTLAERMLDRLQALQSAVNERRPDDRPRFVLRFEPADALPASLVARNADTREEIALGRVDEAGLDGLQFDEAWVAQLYPAPQGPTLAERLAGALQRLQQQVDAGRPADGPQFRLRLEPADALPARIVAQGPDNAPLELGQATEANLDTLALGPDVLTRLYPPPPSDEQLAEAFLAQVRAAAPRAADPRLVALGGGAYSVAARHEQAELLAFPRVARADGAESFSPDAAAVGRHFELQVDALARAAAPPAGWIRVAAEYDPLIRVAGAALQPAAVDVAAGTVTLRGSARLEGDPRAAEAFALSGVDDGTALTADEASRAAFAEYLVGVQREKLTAKLPAIQQALPAGVTARAPTPFAGGPQVQLEIVAGSVVLGGLDGEWSPAELEYAFGTDGLGAAIAASIRTAAAGDDARTALNAGWPAFRGQVQPAASAPGGVLFASAELAALAVAGEPDAADPLRVALTVGATAGGETIEFPAAVRLAETGWTWEAACAASAKNAIAERLAALAGERRTRRDQALAAELAQELGVAANAVTAGRENDQLLLSARTGDGERRFELTWNAAELDYAERRELAAVTPEPEPEPKPDPTVPTPPADINAKLAQLASQGTITPDAAADVLASVVQAKLARLGEANYAASADLGGGAAGLARISERWRSLVVADSAKDPFPNVFIEYFVGATDVYGIGWRVDTDAGDRVTGIAEARVWKALGTAELRGLGSPEAVRNRLSEASAGERLLGAGLGSSLRASTGGSYGVLIAPDEALWMVRWPTVAFNSRRVENLRLEGAKAVDPVTRLGDIVEGERVGRADFKYRRSGVWCTPSLGGTWKGAGRRGPSFTLGSLGGKEFKAGCREQDGVWFAGLADPTLTGFAGAAVGQLKRNEFGNKFWALRGDGGWQSTPYVSFVVVRQGD